MRNLTEATIRLIEIHHDTSWPAPNWRWAVAAKPPGHKQFRGVASGFEATPETALKIAQNVKRLEELEEEAAKP